MLCVSNSVPKNSGVKFMQRIVPSEETANRRFPFGAQAMSLTPLSKISVRTKTGLLVTVSNTDNAPSFAPIAKYDLGFSSDEYKLGENFVTQTLWTCPQKWLRVAQLSRDIAVDICLNVLTFPPGIIRVSPSGDHDSLWNCRAALFLYRFEKEWTGLQSAVFHIKIFPSAD